MFIKDSNFFDNIVKEGVGYIYNDFGTQFPGNSPTWNTRDFNKLHRTTCSQVKRMTYRTEEKLTKHFFKSRTEAVDWLLKNRKEEGYTFCKYCNP